jgi:transcriptional regulator with XRE-family HTH domain
MVSGTRHTLHDVHIGNEVKPKMSGSEIDIHAECAPSFAKPAIQFAFRVSNGGEENVPSTNRIKELRALRGWSYAEVAKRVADNTSPSTIQKLEQGGMQLTPKWAERMARAFGVSAMEIYEPPRLASLTPDRRRLAEDVAPYSPDLPTETAGNEAREPPAGSARYIVTSRALDELGLIPGMVVEVNETPAAIKSVATGDIVIADVTLPGHAHATTVMREFIEPALLITNSSERNETPIHMRQTPTRIAGVVETAFKSLRRPR